MQSIFSHRSIRRYRQERLTEEQLSRLAEAANRASNTGNMQLYSVILTTDEAVKASLAPAHFNQPMVTSAPLVVTVCADINRMNHWCRLRNADAGFGNAETLISATVDAVIAAQNIALAAEEMGLGICYLGTTTYNPDKIVSALNLPVGVMPITTITVGYPAEEPGLTERLPVSGIAHRDTYHDYSDDDIARLYADKEANPANRQFVADNNKETLAQVFAEVRYSRAANEAFSETLLKTIKNQGF